MNSALLDFGWQRRESIRASLKMIKALFLRNFKGILNSKLHTQRPTSVKSAQVQKGRQALF